MSEEEQHREGGRAAGTGESGPEPAHGPDGLSRALVETVSEYALFLTDPAGTVLTASPGARRILGWDVADIVGRNISVIFTPEDVAAGVPQDELETAARDGHAPDDRWQMRRDGTRIFVSGAVEPVRGPGGEVRGFTKVLRDATQRRQREERLERKAALIDLAFEAIISHEPGTNRVTFWSRGAEETYGWTREEAVDRQCFDLLRTEFPVSLEAVWRALEATGRWEGDLVHTCRNGSRITVASRWALQRDADGKALAVLEVNRDVTAERQQEVERAAAADEHRRVAETLQRSLLLTPPPDAFPGVTVKTLYEPAWDDALIGGDVFDVFALTDDRVACVVGDVTGKGLGAATYTAEVKFVLRGYLREHPSPGVALERLNNFVVESERLDWAYLGSTYVALACAVVDTRTGDVVCAAAGMEAPFVLRARTGEADPLCHTGPLLGVESRISYRDHWEHLGEEDVMALFTDGLTEARRGRGNEFFGYDGVVRAVREERAALDSLAQIGEAVAARARAFAGGRLQDDVCLLLVRRASAVNARRRGGGVAAPPG